MIAMYIRSEKFLALLSLLSLSSCVFLQLSPQKSASTAIGRPQIGQCLCSGILDLFAAGLTDILYQFAPLLINPAVPRFGVSFISRKDAISGK